MENGFSTLNDLARALSAAGQGLERGDLDLDGLEQACSDAREFYERLIILRHKAREAAVGRAPKEEDVAAKENRMRSNVAESSQIRLDTRPPDVSPRQTSLIDAIEHHEVVPSSIKDPVKSGDPPPAGEKPVKLDRIKKDKPTTLAEKLEKASITNLGKAISLSHKFWFVSELYNGDRIFYEKSIERLDAMSGRDEAETFVQQEVIANLKKPADPAALSAFMDLIERRFQ